MGQFSKTLNQEKLFGKNGLLEIYVKLLYLNSKLSCTVTDVLDAWKILKRNWKSEITENPNETTIALELHAQMLKAVLITKKKN